MPKCRIRTRAAASKSKNRGPYHRYDEASLSLAVNTVLEKKLTERAAAKAFKVPRATLQRCVNRTSGMTNNTCTPTSTPSSPPNDFCTRVSCIVNPLGVVQLNISVDLSTKSRMQHKKSIINLHTQLPVASSASPGATPIMQYEEEKAFADYLVACSDRNLPVSKTLANNKARQILERRGAKFTTKSGLPSKEWWYGFIKRFPQVGIRKKQDIHRGRAVLTQESVDAFFTDLHTLKVRKQITAEVNNNINNNNNNNNCVHIPFFCSVRKNIYSADEVGVSGLGTSDFVVASRFARRVYSITDTKEHVSLMCCYSAAGTFLPPFFIFRGEKLMQGLGINGRITRG